MSFYFVQRGPRRAWVALIWSKGYVIACTLPHARRWGAAIEAHKLIHEMGKEVRS